MGCLELGFWMITGSFAVSLILAIGSAALVRFRFYRSFLVVAGWPMMVIAATALPVTWMGAFESRLAANDVLVLLNWFWGFVATIGELAMLLGLVTLSFSSWGEGRIRLFDDSPVAEFLRRIWIMGRSGPFGQMNQGRNVCSLSWGAAFSLCCFLIALALVVVLYVLLVLIDFGILRNRPRLDPSLPPQKIISFPPLLVLIISFLVAALAFGSGLGVVEIPMEGWYFVCGGIWAIFSVLLVSAWPRFSALADASKAAKMRKLPIVAVPKRGLGSILAAIKEAVCPVVTSD